MKNENGRRAPKRGHIAAVVVTVVGLSLLMMFGVLYALTPATIVTVEGQAAQNGQ